MIHSNSKITMLDCTLRDGGYYNKWDFDNSLIYEYLDVMSRVGVSVVELGFRSLKNNEYKGALAFTTDGFLDRFDIPGNLKIAVMINGSEFMNLDAKSIEKKLERLFPCKASASKVSLVRLAIHISEQEVVEPVVRFLSGKDYEVAVNVMQISKRTKDEIAQFCHVMQGLNIDLIYFADSLGSLSVENTKNVTSWFSEHWAGSIGIHAHDNLNLALMNSAAAVECGASWVDATVYGMGRGPGNCKLEELLFNIEGSHVPNFAASKLVRLIETYFQPLKDKYKWGSNLFYHLAGLYEIHPSYIQEMSNDSRFTDEDMLSFIMALKGGLASAFSFDVLHTKVFYSKSDIHKRWRPSDSHEKSSFILIGGGTSASKYDKDLEILIKRHKPIVISLNVNEKNDSLVDYYLACNPTRMLADIDKYKSLNKPLITPLSNLPDELKNQLKPSECLDFGIDVEQGRFAIFDDHCVLANPIAIAYALSVCVAAKASEVYLIGFDGYQNNDKRHLEVEYIFERFIQDFGLENIILLTPSSYKAPKPKSIYGYI